MVGEVGVAEGEGEEKRPGSCGRVVTEAATAAAAAAVADFGATTTKRKERI